ncbi:hypothetical protein ACHHYP_01680 [Achlya hypogyna]|uniref:Uncharacterized protein n=1 Tax=Achlya hypogyna TaxID=1202772 RepID=A0A1V9Z806_ACHHY|nr:hypothetical protein ACHHYP_01680 [Achlya hypogyna]
MIALAGIARRSFRPLVALGVRRPVLQHSAARLVSSTLRLGIQRLQVEKRYSEIVVHNNTVYLSGQLADDLGGDITAQTQETLHSIDQLLADAGSDKSRILSVTIYLKDMADYAAMNAVWDAWVPVGATPARATVEAKLYDSAVLVEMSVIAAA